MGNSQKVFHFSDEEEGGLFQICDARKSDPPTTATDPPLVFQNLGSKGGSVAGLCPDARGFYETDSQNFNFLTRLGSIF